MTALPNYPRNTIAVEWGVAFGEFVAEGGVLNEDTMADWFDAAFDAARREGCEPKVLPPAPAGDAPMPATSADGVWLTNETVEKTVNPPVVRAWASEIDALRHAVANGALADFVKWGEEL